MHFRPAFLAWRKYPEDLGQILRPKNASQVTTPKYDTGQTADSYAYYTQYNNFRYRKLHLWCNFPGRDRLCNKNFIVCNNLSGTIGAALDDAVAAFFSYFDY